MRSRSSETIWAVAVAVSASPRTGFARTMRTTWRRNRSKRIKGQQGGTVLVNRLRPKENKKSTIGMHNKMVVRTVVRTVTAKSIPARNLRRRSEEHTSELQSPCNLVCRLLLEKK